MWAWTCLSRAWALRLKGESVEQGSGPAPGSNRLRALAISSNPVSLPVVESPPGAGEDEMAAEPAEHRRNQGGIGGGAFCQGPIDVDAELRVDRVGGALERQLHRCLVGFAACQLAQELSRPLPLGARCNAGVPADEIGASP